MTTDYATAALEAMLMAAQRRADDLIMHPKADQIIRVLHEISSGESPHGAAGIIIDL